MSKGEGGYIPIFRKFFDHYLWEEKREFSKAEAWIDCIQMARYKEDKKKKLIAGNLIEWGYGQFPASIRFLRERWGWGSNTKVVNFLELLEKDNMIKLEKEQGQNIVTLCNYSTYDIKNISEKDTKKTERRRTKDREKTERRQNSNKDNKGKKEKNVNISPLISDFDNIQKMEQPLTKEEGERLVDEYGSQQVKNILMQMENWKPLIKKNKSANLTARNWLNKKQSNGTTKTKGDRHVDFLSS